MEELEEFKVRYLTNYYNEIEQRFNKKDSEHLNNFRIFQPQNFPNTLAELQNYGNKEVENLIIF